MNSAPIVFFAYKRPKHTQIALESLSQNEGAEKSELFIFCDGPKDDTEQAATEKVRQIVKSRPWCRKVNIVENLQNQGLAKSIVSGVSQIVDRCGRVIVVEDDLVLSTQFLNYMNDALDFYQDNHRAMHVAGFMWPLKADLPETFFVRNSACWGWGTWRRAWQHFNPDAATLLRRIKAEGKADEFSFRGTRRYIEMLQNHIDRKIDSWSIRWYASIYLKNGLSLYPRRSLVKNIGHDGSGVHCGVNSAHDHISVSEKRVRHFSNEVAEDPEIFDQLVNADEIKPFFN